MSLTSWHILQVGACRHPHFMAQKGASFCPVSFPALVGLIIHKTHGPILFDTGYDERFFSATQTFPERLYRLITPVQYNPRESLVEQLKAFDLIPSDISYVFVSHFHADHIAGLKRFDKARIFCARAGLERIKTGGRFARVRQGLLSDLVPEDIEQRAIFFEDFAPFDLPQTMTPFDTGVDLFGDQSLMAIELPGHCAGHWGLWIRPDHGSSAFLVGDAAWSSTAIINNLPPPDFTTSLLGENHSYKQTLTKLNALAKNHNSQVEIIPSHCQKAAQKWVKTSNVS